VIKANDATYEMVAEGPAGSRSSQFIPSDLVILAAERGNGRPQPMV